MNISVMDNGANLVGFLRMDGAWLGSVDIAMKKVRALPKINHKPKTEVGKKQLERIRFPHLDFPSRPRLPYSSRWTLTLLDLSLRWTEYQLKKMQHKHV